MGFWGFGPFDNDYVHDWLVDAEDDPEGIVSKTLASLTYPHPGRPLSRGNAAEALGLAELLLCGAGRGRHEVPEGTAHLVGKLRAGPEDLARLAGILAQVKTSDLMQAIGHHPEWNEMVEDIMRRFADFVAP